MDFLPIPLAIKIEKETIDNEFYRRILYTTPLFQLAVMTLAPNEYIPLEIHLGDQFVRIEKGQAYVGITNYGYYELKDGEAIIIPLGYEHFIGNRGKTPLKLYTIYTPPQHWPYEKEYDQP